MLSTIFDVMDRLAPYAQDGTVFLAFCAAFGAAMLWVYKRVIKPVHKKVERILDIADYQFEANGGQSMRDAINRLEDNQSKNNDEAQAHWKSLESGQKEMGRKLGGVERITSQTERRMAKVELAIEKLKDIRNEHD